jgi:hypothetical protein
MKKVALLFGALASLLGGLWLLQGLDVVHVWRMLCFSNCAPVSGASPKWTMIGAGPFAVGLASVFWFLKLRLKSP